MATIVRSQISNPQSNQTVTGSLRGNVILVSKFSFNAEGESELSIKKGDILKLLDRPGDGWLLVKFIDKVRSPGLVPASYVDIAVNDANHPITLPWLQSQANPDEEEDILSEQNYLNVQTKGGKPLTVNNKPYPVSVSVANFLFYNQRIWYRVDIEFSDGSKSYSARYYQDFYNLHVRLLALQQYAQGTPGTKNQALALPKLPEPIPSHGDTAAEQDIPLLLKRCNDLNIYINKLLLNKHYQMSGTCCHWFQENFSGRPGFKVKTEEEKSADNDTINGMILPGSFDLLKSYQDQKAMDEQYEDEKVVPQRTKSKNTYNLYQQAAQFSTPSRQNSTSTTIQRKKSTGHHGPYPAHNPSHPDPTPPTVRWGSNSSQGGQGPGPSSVPPTPPLPAQALNGNTNGQMNGNINGHMNGNANGTYVQHSSPKAPNQQLSGAPQYQYGQQQPQSVQPQASAPPPSQGPPKGPQVPVPQAPKQDIPSETQPFSFTPGAQSGFGISYPNQTAPQVSQPIQNGGQQGQPIQGQPAQEKAASSPNLSLPSTFPVDFPHQSYNPYSGDAMQSSPRPPPPPVQTSQLPPQSEEEANGTAQQSTPSPKTPQLPSQPPSTGTTPVGARPASQPYTGRIQPRASQASWNGNHGAGAGATANGSINPIVGRVKQMSVSSSSTSSSSTSSSPTLSHQVVNNTRHQFIKCKIANGQDEIIAIKLDKSSIGSVEEFKDLVKQKIFFVDLFIRMPNSQNYENIDRLQFNLAEFLRHNDKVLLKVG